MQKPQVKSWFDNETNTITHIAWDEASKQAAIFDPVLGYDAASGRTTPKPSEALLEFVKDNDLDVKYIIETHAHADHLSSAPYIKEKLGADIVIGNNITKVQNVFSEIFNAGPDFAKDGSQFDILSNEGEELSLGNIPIKAIHTPGHTPACMSYLIGDALFVGDTLFAPDFGTARCDFPGGSAETLYDSIQKLFSLPDETRVFLCHDYLPQGRSEYVFETTIGEEKAHNIHVGGGKSKQEFVKMRTERDAQLAMPRLILPSVQVNMRAGHFPPAEDNGVHYLKIPLNAL